MFRSWRSTLAEPGLAELPEAQANGDTAAFYARIRAETGAPLVNLVWRHLATLPGGAAAWAWEVAQANAGRLPVAAIVAAADQAAMTLAGAAPALPRLRPEAAAILSVYNRNNAANLARVAAILAALDAPGGAPPAPGAEPAAGTKPMPPLPSLPGWAELSPEDREAAARLAEAGPAFDSGVFPSLWRHLAVQPGLMPALAPVLSPVLADPGFAAAWTRLLAVAAAPGTLCVPAVPEAMDRAGLAAGVGAFARRIAELTLAGRIVTLWCPDPDNAEPIAEEASR